MQGCVEGVFWAGGYSFGFRQTIMCLSRTWTANSFSEAHYCQDRNTHFLSFCCTNVRGLHSKHEILLSIETYDVKSFPFLGHNSSCILDFCVPVQDRFKQICTLCIHLLGVLISHVLSAVCDAFKNNLLGIYGIVSFLYLSIGLMCLTVKLKDESMRSSALVMQEHESLTCISNFSSTVKSDTNQEGLKHLG